MNTFGTIFIVLAILRYYGLIELHFAWLIVWLMLDIAASIPKALERRK